MKSRKSGFFGPELVDSLWNKKFFDLVALGERNDSGLKLDSGVDTWVDISYDFDEEFDLLSFFDFGTSCYWVGFGGLIGTRGV